MKISKTIAFVFVALSFMYGSSIHAMVLPTSSTFDTDNDGWVLGTGQTGSITHSPIGGNPDGYIQFTDSGSTAGDIYAPTKYLGDWSDLDGIAKLMWDHKIINDGGAVNTILSAQATISGSGGVATFDSGVLGISSSWLSVTAIIDESLWNVTSGTWLSLLSDVSELSIKIELVDGVNDIEGIDNVALVYSSVPVPGSLVLMLSGVIGLASVKRKLANKRIQPTQKARG